MYALAYVAKEIPNNTAAVRSKSSGPSNLVKAGYIVDIIATFVAGGDYTHNAKATKENKNFFQASAKKEISCSAAASYLLQMCGSLVKNQMIKHTDKKTKVTNNINSRFSGSEYLRNCTLVHFTNDTSGKVSNKLDKSVKLEVKKGNLKDGGVLYKDLPDKYKVKGAIYVYRSANDGKGHIAINSGKKNGVTTIDSYWKSDENKMKKQNKGPETYTYTEKSEFRFKETQDKKFVNKEQIVDVILPDS